MSDDCGKMRDLGAILILVGCMRPRRRSVAGLLLGLGVALLGGHPAAGGAETDLNEALHRQIVAWEDGIREGRARQILKEIEAVASGKAAWNEPVLAEADGVYNWGFLTGLTKAWALKSLDRPVEMYRTLVETGGMGPETPPEAREGYHYWRWFIAMGDACHDLTRLQDATWYYGHVRDNVSTNAGHYWQATVLLAATYNRQSRADLAIGLYDEVLLNRPDQPPSVWRAYTDMLFDAGFFEEGVETILAGAEAHGLSTRGYVDHFAQSACKYWSFFADEQVVRWYALLGRSLRETQLARGVEEHLAWLINTRGMIEKAYPGLILPEGDDLAALRQRAETEPPILPGELAAMARRRAGGSREQPAGRRPGQRSRTGGVGEDGTDRDGLRVAIEDDVNRALVRSLYARRRGFSEGPLWEKLLGTYSADELREVVVDGMSALFHGYAALGAYFSHGQQPVEAKGWLLKALEESDAQESFNRARLADMLIRLGDIHLTNKLNDPAEAARYFYWARSAAEGYRRQEYLVLAGLAGVALQSEEDGPDQRRRLLQDVVDRFGCLPRRGIYERLARDSYRTGQFRQGFKALEDGFKRSTLIEGVTTDHLVEGLVMTRSLHSSEELARLRRLFRSGVLRFPATIRFASSISPMLALSEADWIAEHEALARLEETGAYWGDTGWAAITNALATSPSVRAGLLHARAALARRTSPGEAPDWSGWTVAWRLVEDEFRSRYEHAPTDVGGGAVAYELLLDMLLPHLSVLAESDFEEASSMVEADVRRLSHRQFDRTAEAFARVDTLVEFRLHLARMKAVKNTPPTLPSFQRMALLFAEMPPELRAELAALVAQKRDEAFDPALKRGWDPFLAQFGVAQ